MNRKILTTLVALLFSATILFANALGTLANSMNAGEWRELATTGLSQTFLETSGNNAANHSILQYAAKGMWDPATEQFFFLGSPHDNPYKFIIYSASNNTWRTGPLPNSCMNTGMYSGGCALHSYYYAAAVDNGKFYTYTGAAGGKIYSYDIAGNSWAAVSGNPIPLYGPTYGGCAYSPERQGFIYACGNVGVWFCSKATGTWSEVSLPSGMSWGYYQSFVHYNPVHHEILFGGGESGKQEVYKVSNSGTLAVTHLSSSPIPIGVGCGNVAIDPVTGKYIVCTGSQMSEFNSQTNQWATLSNLPPSEIRPEFIYEIANASVSNYGVIMYLTYSPAKVYLYKHSAGNAVEQLPMVQTGAAIHVDPNPVMTGGVVSIRASGALSKAEVYDLAGKLVFQSGSDAKTQGGIGWSTKNAPAGVYLVKAMVSGQTAVKRIVLTK